MSQRQVKKRAARQQARKKKANGNGRLTPAEIKKMGRVWAIVAGEGLHGNDTTMKELMKILECEHRPKGLKIECIDGYKPTGLQMVHGYSRTDELLEKHRLRAVINSLDGNTLHLVDAETDDPVSVARVQGYLADLRKAKPEDLPCPVEQLEKLAKVLLDSAIDAPADVNQYGEAFQSSVLKDEQGRYPKPAA